MVEKGISRRAILLGGASAVGLAAIGLGMDNRVKSGHDLAERPLDGKPRERRVVSGVIRGFEDKDTGAYYEPVFREAPSIESRELQDQELEELGYARQGEYQGVKVYGDAGNLGRVVKSIADGQVNYSGWFKLGNGVYVSDNFVDYQKKPTNSSNQ